MSQFPLLSLPSLAIAEVLKLLDPFELFDLSQCSRKSFAIIRLAGTKRYELLLQSSDVVVNEKYQFRSSTYQKFPVILGKRKFFLANGKEIIVYVKCFRGPCHFRNFNFADWDLGLQTILFYLTELFGCRIDSINTERYFSGKIQRSIMGWVIEKQKEIKILAIDDNLNENDLKWIMDNLTVTDYFECDVSTSRNFGYKFKTYSRHFSIHDSDWFKLDDLLAAAKSCVVIRLYESRLSNKDIDVFMKAWSSGEFPTLRYLEVASKNLNRRYEILGRNQAEWRNNRGGVFREYVEIDGKSYRMYRGVEIRRDDGIKAEVDLDLDLYQKYFRLHVI